MEPERPIPLESDPESETESSLSLLERARAGDRDALERLMTRYLPRLTRWASGRAPAWAREESDTDDLVQDALMHSLRRLDGFEPRHKGAFQAYLRQAVINRIRDQVRRRLRTPPASTLDSDATCGTPSPLDQAIGAETLRRYEDALAQLRPDDRALVVSRVELGQSYEELMLAFDKPTINATRVAVCRALTRLARQMGS